MMLGDRFSKQRSPNTNHDEKTHYANCTLDKRHYADSQAISRKCKRPYATKCKVSINHRINQLPQLQPFRMQ